MRRYTEEQKQFLREYIPGHSYKEIMRAFNLRFKDDLSTSQVKGFIANNKLNTGRTGRFERGHSPANKGKKMTPEQYAKCKSTMFKEKNLTTEH